MEDIPYEDDLNYSRILNNVKDCARSCQALVGMSLGLSLSAAFLGDPNPYLFAKTEKEFERLATAEFHRLQSRKLRKLVRFQRFAVKVGNFLPGILCARTKTHARSYRRSRHVTATDSDSGDDGQGDSDPEPPKKRPHVIFKLSNHDSFSLPWPRHGCLRVGGRSS